LLDILRIGAARGKGGGYGPRSNEVIARSFEANESGAAISKIKSFNTEGTERPFAGRITEGHREKLTNIRGGAAPVEAVKVNSPQYSQLKAAPQGSVGQKPDERQGNICTS
jgi:hypothetical protein